MALQDPQAEPSMEEILASIRRIISEEEQAPTTSEPVLDLTQAAEPAKMRGQAGPPRPPDRQIEPQPAADHRVVSICTDRDRCADRLASSPAGDFDTDDPALLLHQIAHVRPLPDLDPG